MKILITGVTETHNNHPDRASSTKFVSIPELMREALLSMGHDVTHDYVHEDTDLARFDRVFLYLYPLDHNAVHPMGPQRVLRERMDAIICLDDWSFQKILPSWDHVIPAKDLADHKWLAPLFPWGDVKKMNLPVDQIMSWDPSPLYDLPACHHLTWRLRKTEWYNASLSKDAHDWATAQKLTWPVYAIGGKALGQPRILETDVVWQYGGYKGVLCPSYAHAGCGWWRVRYLHAAHAGAVLGGDPKELGMIDSSYSYTLHELEKMDDTQLQLVAATQALNLNHATRDATITRLTSILS
jgi:hypothetical protein